MLVVLPLVLLSFSFFLLHRCYSPTPLFDSLQAPALLTLSGWGCDSQGVGVNTKEDG